MIVGYLLRQCIWKESFRMNYACHSGFRWPFWKNSRCYGWQKVLHDMQKAMLRWPELFDRGQFWTLVLLHGGQTFTRWDSGSWIFLCVCAQGFVNLCWHKDPCMMYHFKGTLMPKFDKSTFLQLFALIPQPGSEWPRLVVNINVKPVRRSKDEPVGWWLMQPGANIIHCLIDTTSSAPIGENLRDTVYLRINFTVHWEHIKAIGPREAIRYSHFYHGWGVKIQTQPREAYCF